MSDEQQNAQVNEEKDAKKCAGKSISCVLYILVIISLIFSIISSTLTIINMANAGEGIIPVKEKSDKKVVISKQYDKGQSLKKAYKTHKPVVVFFYTDWCGFCQRFVPTFYKVTKDREIKKKFAVAYVNCENSENREYMQDFGVQGFPTVFVIAKDGTRTHLENGTFFNDDSVKVIKENMLKAIDED